MKGLLFFLKLCWLFSVPDSSLGYKYKDLYYSFCEYISRLLGSFPTGICKRFHFLHL